MQFQIQALLFVTSSMCHLKREETIAHIYNRPTTSQRNASSNSRDKIILCLLAVKHDSFDYQR
jgi:hypothetical protein